MTTASHQDLFKSSIASLRVAGATSNLKLANSNEVAPISPPSSIKKAESIASSTTTEDLEVSGGREDYDGNYKFAPIKEHITARAMSRRYGDDLVNTAISDIVIGTYTVHLHLDPSSETDSSRSQSDAVLLDFLAPILLLLVVLT